MSRTLTRGRSKPEEPRPIMEDADRYTIASATTMNRVQRRRLMDNMRDAIQGMATKIVKRQVAHF